MTNAAVLPSQQVFGQPPQPGAPLQPIAGDQRIHAIDATRGLALLGIFLVNIMTFADAFGTFMHMKPADDAGPFDLFAHYFTFIFCTSKFYPLFSLLFGIGLTIQWQRARAAGRPLIGTGIRRLIVLGILGLAHALLLWYGDILFIYSTVGLLLLFTLNLRARTLAIIGGSLLTVAVVFGTGFGLLMFAMQAAQADRAAAPTAITAPAENPAAPASEEPPDEAAAQPTAPDEGPFLRLMHAFETGEGVEEGPASPLWIATEREAYAKGPYFDLFAFRAFTWLQFLIYAATSMWWHVAAMFLFGAAMFKAGLFDPSNRHWHRRFVIIGIAAGLPLAILSSIVPHLATESFAMVAVSPLMMLGGPLLSLAYLGGITMLAQSGKLRPLITGLASAGRMALTNYLMQTIIATTIFYYYGFALFGQLSAGERFLIPLIVFPIQIIFSILWLQAFRFGPMEWLWRSLTYLKPQPMRKRA